MKKNKIIATVSAIAATAATYAADPAAEASSLADLKTTLTTQISSAATDYIFPILGVGATVVVAFYVWGLLKKALKSSK